MGKISEFTELTSADAEDLLPIVDTSAGITKKIRIDSLGVNLPTLAEVDAVAPTDKMLLYDVSTSAYKSVEAGDVGINISTLTEVDAIASTDKIPVYDVSTSTNKYVEAGDLMADNGEKKYFANFEITPGAVPTITATPLINTLGVVPTVTISSTYVSITATNKITTKTYAATSAMSDSENSYYYLIIPGIISPSNISLYFYRTTNETSIDFTILGEPIFFSFGFTVYP